MEVALIYSFLIMKMKLLRVAVQKKKDAVKSIIILPAMLNIGYIMDLFVWIMKKCLNHLEISSLSAKCCRNTMLKLCGFLFCVHITAAL